jgi:DNA modification methylase
VFDGVRRVLAGDGTLWLNVGDCYASAWPAPNTRRNIIGNPMTGGKRGPQRQAKLGFGCKEKDLMMMPARLAIALQAAGWWVRSDIVWSKPNPMPESVTDRPTKAHEYVFLLSKGPRYFYDADAIAEPAIKGAAGSSFVEGKTGLSGMGRVSEAEREERDTRNARSVWTIASQPFAGAHFATMPPKLAERCILAGSRIGDEVLDPFLGSGTVGMVAEALGRRWFGVELQPDYEKLIKQRTAQVGLFGRTGS